MKKIILCLFLVNLSLFSQQYTERLYDAIEDNNTEEIKYIVNEYDIDLNNTFLRKETPLSGQYEYAYLNFTPLIWAIDCKNLEAIDTLLKLGANLELESRYYNIRSFSMLPLMVAVNLDENKKMEKVVSFLMQKGAKIDAKNREGKTALMYAVCCEGRRVGSINLCRMLINAGADVHIKDNEGITALMYAAYSHDSECVDLLIKNNANINEKDKNSAAALIYACKNSSFGLYGSLNPNVVKSLIKAGADVNVTDNEGNTALLYAVMIAKEYLSYDGCEETDSDYKNIYETIEILLKNGAKVNIKNKKGESPLSISTGSVTDLLVKYGAY